MNPKYIQISQDIEEKILRGGFQSGDKLPTEEYLVNHYDVSRNTIRKAIDNLSKKGYIMPVQGSGMYIRDINLREAVNLENFRGLTYDFPNSTITTEILELKYMVAGEALAKKMKCEPDTPLLYVSRKREIDGIPWVVEYSYFNLLLVPGLDESVVEKSIYSYIRDELKQQIGFVDRIIEASSLNEIDAQSLGLNPGDPALVSTNVSMYKSGEIFDYSIDIHNYKQTRFLKLSSLMY